MSSLATKTLRRVLGASLSIGLLCALAPVGMAGPTVTVPTAPGATPKQVVVPVGPLLTLTGLNNYSSFPPGQPIYGNGTSPVVSVDYMGDNFISGATGSAIQLSATGHALLVGQNLPAGTYQLTVNMTMSGTFPTTATISLNAPPPSGSVVATCPLAFNNANTACSAILNVNSTTSNGFYAFLTGGNGAIVSNVTFTKVNVGYAAP